MEYKFNTSDGIGTLIIRILKFPYRYTTYAIINTLNNFEQIGGEPETIALTIS